LRGIVDREQLSIMVKVSITQVTGILMELVIILQDISKMVEISQASFLHFNPKQK